MRTAPLLALVGALTTIAIATPPAIGSPGDLEPGFGTTGTSSVQFAPVSPGPPSTTIGAVALGPGGDIYVAGTTEDSTSEVLYLARYLPSGALDASFGVGGVSIEQIGQGSTKSSGLAAGTVEQIAVTPSGDIVVPATASDPAGNSQIAVAEFTSSGALNTSFAATSPTPGVYYDDSTSTAPTTGSGAYAGTAAAQGDGKIVFTAVAAPSSGAESFIRRLNANGTVDTGFATGGTYTAPAGSAAVPTEINDAIVNSGGQIVFTGGTPGSTAGTSQIMLGELNADGSVATGFPRLFQASTAPISPYSVGYSLFQAADGDYIVGGGSQFTLSATTGLGSGGFIAVAFTSAGAVDTSFGPSGSGITTLGPVAAVMGATPPPGPAAIAQQANGRLVFTGPDPAGPEFAVERTLANGTVDPDFGSDGVADFGFSTLAESESLVIGPDGQLILGGYVTGGALSSVHGILAKVVLDAPSVTIAAGPAVAGQPVSFSALTQSGATVAWDLGSGTFTDAAGTTAVKTFASAGTPVVRVKVTDDDGQTATATQTVTVAAAPASATTSTATPTSTPTSTPTTVTVTTPTPIPTNECTSSAQPTTTLATKILTKQGLILSGTAAANCPRTVAGVGVAIARSEGRKCRFLTAHHRWGKPGSCTPSTFLAASGTYEWGLALKLKLTARRYWVWARATDNTGATTPTPESDHIALKRR